MQFCLHAVRRWSSMRVQKILRITGFQVFKLCCFKIWFCLVVGCFSPRFQNFPKIPSITGFRTGYIIHVYTGLQDTSKWIFRRKASNRSLRSGSIKDNDGADLPKVQVLLLSKSMSIKWIRWILTFGTHKCI